MELNIEKIAAGLVQRLQAASAAEALKAQGVLLLYEEIRKAAAQQSSDQPSGSAEAKTETTETKNPTA